MLHTRWGAAEHSTSAHDRMGVRSTRYSLPGSSCGRLRKRGHDIGRSPRPDRRSRAADGRLLRLPLLGVHERTDDVQRHSLRPAVQQQGVRKRNIPSRVVPKRLDEAAMRHDKSVDQGQLMYALNRNPLRAGQHHAGGVDFIGVLAPCSDQRRDDQSHLVPGVGVPRLEQRRENTQHPLPRLARHEERRIRHVFDPHAAAQCR